MTTGERARRWGAESGQAMTEYAVVLILLAAVVAALTATGLAGTIVGELASKLSGI